MEGNVVELRVLKYFLTVSQEENITKAAQLLHITQPTLSRQLMQLEEELGVKLFERSSHSIILTNDGMLLKRRAQEIVSLAEKTKKELTTEKELVGEFAIGSGEFISFSYLTKILSLFVKQNPNVCLKIHSGNADAIKEQLESGVLDVGMLSDPVDISKYEFIRLPQKEKWGVVVHKDFEIASKEYVTPGDLVGLPIIMPNRRLIWDELKSWFGKHYESVDVFAYHDLLYNAAIMAKNKMGIVLTLKLESNFNDLKFIPLNPTLEFGTVLVWKKNQVRSVITDAFIDFAKKYLKNDSDNSL